MLLCVRIEFGGMLYKPNYLPDSLVIPFIFPPPSPTEYRVQSTLLVVMDTADIKYVSIFCRTNIISLYVRGHTPSYIHLTPFTKTLKGVPCH